MECCEEIVLLRGWGSGGASQCYSGDKGAGFKLENRSVNCRDLELMIVAEKSKKMKVHFRMYSANNMYFSYRFTIIAFYNIHHLLIR
jgi:hypothetical protein